jgi:hypothetical protein
MQNQENATSAIRKRVPWIKGKVTGAKPPLRPRHVWAIRTKLQIESRARDLAMLNLTIVSKLRGCDVVADQSRGCRCERIHCGPRNRTKTKRPPSGGLRSRGSKASYHVTHLPPRQ